MSGRNRWLSAFAVLIYAFLFAPIVVLILFSFNNSRRTFVWHGFTLDWYPKLFENGDLLDALRVTMIVAVDVGSPAPVRRSPRSPPININSRLIGSPAKISRRVRPSLPPPGRLPVYLPEARLP